MKHDDYDDDDSIICIDSPQKNKIRSKMDDDVSLDDSLFDLITVGEWKRLIERDKRAIESIIKGENILKEVEDTPAKAYVIVLGLIQSSIERRKNGKDKMVSLIVMSTREICSIVMNLATKMCQNQNMMIVDLSVDLPFTSFRTKLASLPDIIIATPFTLLSNLESQNLNLIDSMTVFLAIDQLDVLLSMGYENDIMLLFNHLPKGNLQTAFFVKQINNEVQKIQKFYTNRVEIAIVATTMSQSDEDYSYLFLRFEHEGDENEKQSITQTQKPTHDENNNILNLSATSNIRTTKIIASSKCRLKKQRLLRHLFRLKYRSIYNLEKMINKQKQCQICKKFVMNLYVHKKTHKNEKQQRRSEAEKRIQCKICKKDLSKKSIYNHMKIHSVKKFQCNECGFLCHYASVLKRHSIIHDRDASFKCNLCSASFNAYSSFNNHVLRHAPNDHMKWCHVCKKHVQSNLARHLRMHGLEKRFKCIECGLEFGYASGLKKHSIVHSRDELHKCNLCSGSFTTTNMLRKHLHIHMLIENEANQNLASKSNFELRTQL